MNNHRFETLCIHSGQTIDETGARAAPLHRTAAYLFKSANHAANLFSLKEAGNIYTRLQNPTCDLLERRMAALEGGAAALVTSSGTSAVFYSIINMAAAGDEIVAADNLYGGTYTQFQDILPQFGIHARFVDARDPSNIEKEINGKTKAVYLETIGNPSLDVADIEAAASVARRNGVPLVVDNTFATPCVCRPIEHGADVVVHSLTKWIGGHGTFIGGVIVDSGRFDWDSPKFPLFSEPEASYHGLRFARDLGAEHPSPFITRARLVPMRNLGACLAPDNAWHALQGIETLALRMERHCSNALAVAKHLQKHPKAEWVRYPGLPDDPSHDVASRLFSNGFGGVVVFGVKGGRESGRRFIDRLRLFSHLANVGDAKSLAIHPASTTHSQLSEQDQAKGGITPGMVRLSIGIENIEDIIEDLDQALEGA